MNTESNTGTESGADFSEYSEINYGPLKDAWRVESDAIEIWKRHGCRGRTASATIREIAEGKETAEGSFIRAHFHDPNGVIGGGVNVDFHIDYSQDAEGNVTIGYDTGVGVKHDALRVPAGSTIGEADALSLLSTINSEMESLGSDVLPEFNPGEAA